MTQAPATPSFGDVVENGWASEENPTRKGYFVRSFKRIGRINPGLTWLITDRAGYFWELQPRVIGDKLTVTPLADALEAQQARIAELEDERDDAISQLKYWFDLSAKLEEQAAPVVLAGLIGHLRTARNGGMPTDMADAASVVLEDYCRLSLGRDLVPVLRGMSRSLADRYEKALRPFAEVARLDIGDDEADADFFKPMSERGARAPLLKVGDLRRAAISIDDAAAKSGKDGESDEVLVDVAASLAAAISLLERGGRKASPSDKMFEHMLSDYRGSLSRARQALSSQGRHEGGER